MDCSCGAITVNAVAVEIVPDLAVTLAPDDNVRDFSQARFPPEVVTVATAAGSTVQSTAAEMSRELPLLKVPVALKRTEESLTSLIDAGVTVITVRLPPVTLRFAVPLTLPREALIKTVPGMSVVAVPLPLMDVMSFREEFQVT
jgi:hypothetical protein